MAHSGKTFFLEFWTFRSLIKFSWSQTIEYSSKFHENTFFRQRFEPFGETAHFPIKSPFPLEFPQKSTQRAPETPAFLLPRNIAWLEHIHRNDKHRTYREMEIESLWLAYARRNIRNRIRLNSLTGSVFHRFNIVAVGSSRDKSLAFHLAVAANDDGMQIGGVCKNSFLARSHLRLYSLAGSSRTCTQSERRRRRRRQRYKIY